MKENTFVVTNDTSAAAARYLALNDTCGGLIWVTRYEKAEHFTAKMWRYALSLAPWLSGKESGLMFIFDRHS
jgi:hypothetical protein